jgi:predicted DNA-binding transcriptional regulator AlpA
VFAATSFACVRALRTGAVDKPLLIPFEALKNYGIDLSRDSIRRLSRAGRFPPARRIGGHRIAFIEAEVCEWVKNLPVAGPRARRINGSLNSRRTSDGNS